MTWDHRVIRRKYENGEEYFAIHEVYYNKDGTRILRQGYTPEEYDNIYCD